MSLSIGNPIARDNRDFYRLVPMATIGERVEWARKQAGLSGGKLAKAVGVSQPTIWQLEHGDSKGTKHLVKIAEVCQVSAKWLDDGTGHPKAGIKTPSVAKFETLTPEAQNRALAVNEALEGSRKKSKRK